MIETKYFWLKTGKSRPTQIEADEYTKKLETSATLLRTDGSIWIVISKGNNFIWVDKEKLNSVLSNC